MGRCGLGPWKCRVAMSTVEKGCGDMKGEAANGGRSEGWGTWAVAAMM